MGEFVEEDGLDLVGGKLGEETKRDEDHGFQEAEGGRGFYRIGLEEGDGAFYSELLGESPELGCPIRGCGGAVAAKAVDVIESAGEA